MDQFSEELINKTIQYFEIKGRPISKEGAAEFLSSLANLAGLVCRVFPIKKEESSLCEDSS